MSPYNWPPAKTFNWSYYTSKIWCGGNISRQHRWLQWMRNKSASKRSNRNRTKYFLALWWDVPFSAKKWTFAHMYFDAPWSRINWFSRCMNGFGEIELKVWWPSLKSALPYKTVNKYVRIFRISDRTGTYFRGRTYFWGGGGGYDKALWKILQGTSLFIVQCFPHTTRCSACFSDYAHTSCIEGYLYSGVCTFGALQPTTNFSENWRGT